MNKELIDRTWSCLPKEFKEEVKEIYDSGIKMMDTRPSSSQIYANKLSTLEGIFGLDNLTSDVEGEAELLYVKRKWVQEMHKNNCDEIRRENISSSDKDCYEYANEVLKTLFGSKCLPDEKNVESLEPKANSNYTPVPEKIFASKWDKTEQKPAEPKNEDSRRLHAESVKESRIASEESHLRNSSQETSNCDNHFDNILKDGFREHNRLHIAATIAAGWLAYHGMTSPETIAMDALAVADALIKECEKGGSK